MDSNNLYAFVLIAAGIYGLRSAMQGKNIDSSENPRLSKRASGIIYALTGIVLIVLGILRLS